MKLPINKNPSIYTYADLAYMNAILESKELLRLKIKNRMLDKWYSSSFEGIDFNGEYVSIFDVPNEKNTEGAIWRICKLCDEIVAYVDYYRVVDNEAYVSFFVSADIHNSKNTNEFAITNYGFYIKNKMYDYNNKKYRWIKLTREENTLIFYASIDGDEWDFIYHDEGIWMSEAESTKIGIQYSLGSIQYDIWRNMNYVQLFLDINDVYGKRWLDYYMFPRKGYDHLYGVFNHFVDTEYHDVNEICDNYGSVSNFVHYSIEQGYYILMRLDEFYVPERISYERIHFEHDNLIYGYNEDCYNILGFEQKIVVSELPLNLLEDACYRNRKIVRHRLCTNEKKLDFNINNLINSLYEYMEGINSSIKFSHLLSQRKGVYGLDVFPCLLNDDKARRLLLGDKRISYILYEHCKIMRKRLDFLYEQNYIYEQYIDELLIKCEDMLYTSEILKSLVIRYEMCKKGEEKIYTYVNILYHKEREFYSKLYDVLRKQEDK